MTHWIESHASWLIVSDDKGSHVSKSGVAILALGSMPLLAIAALLLI